MAAILAAHGLAFDPDAAAAGPTLTAPLTSYQSIVQVVRAGELARRGLQLLPTNNLVPLPTLNAFRSALLGRGRGCKGHKKRGGKGGTEITNPCTGKRGV